MVMDERKLKTNKLKGVVFVVHSSPRKTGIRMDHTHNLVCVEGKITQPDAIHDHYAVSCILHSKSVQLNLVV